jgi:hypothetical protein
MSATTVALSPSLTAIDSSGSLSFCKGAAGTAQQGWESFY